MGIVPKRLKTKIRKPEIEISVTGITAHHNAKTTRFFHDTGINARARKKLNILKAAKRVTVPGLWTNPNIKNIKRKIDANER